MHVALYFHGLLPVERYGGTQRVVVWLARGLAQLGHRVTLLAPHGSRIPEATLVGLDPRQTRRPGFDVTPHIPRSAEILHSHAPLTNPPAWPHVFTLHGNRQEGRRSTPNTIFLSADHARRHGSTAYVYNGVDPSEFIYQREKADYDLFLGRLHSAKGYRWAIEGARRAHRKLVVAGGWRLSWSRGLRYVGAVGGKKKAQLLAGAACLWMPALWDEPFGLTLAEALISGTPVLGTRRGALPEIVTPRVGALGNTLEELVQLRGTLDRIDPEECRSWAEGCFSHIRMAERYLRFYQEYLRTNRLPAGDSIG